MGIKQYILGFICGIGILGLTLQLVATPGKTKTSKYNIASEDLIVNDEAKRGGRKTERLEKELRDYPQDRNVSGEYLLILFTTFRDSSDRTHIQQNTLRNWAQYIPKVITPGE